MRGINHIRGPGGVFIAARRASGGPARAPASAPAAAAGIVRVTPAEPVEAKAFPTQRPLASFLAHLIATREQAPQTRERRRAEPEHAVATYAAAAALAAPPAPKVSRAL
jgi:hypothetical protein